VSNPGFSAHVIINVHPIDPGGGRDWMAISEVAGKAIIAARTHVSGVLYPSLRLFTDRA
jgi:hypothetical protein